MLCFGLMLPTQVFSHFNLTIMITKITLPFLLFITCLLFSCDPYHWRDCSAFYYDYKQWQPIAEQDAMSFVSNANDTIDFILQSSWLSEPYTEDYIGGDASGNDPHDVICSMSAVFKYYSPQLATELSFEFSQKEEYEQPIEKQNVYLHSYFQQKTDSVTTAISVFFLKIEPEFLRYEEHQIRHDSLLLNNHWYYKVVECSPRNVHSDLPPILSKVIFSRGVGLICLADINGKKYFLQGQ